MRSAITIDLGGHVAPGKEVDIKWGFCDSKAVLAFVSTAWQGWGRVRILQSFQCSVAGCH